MLNIVKSGLSQSCLRNICSDLKNVRLNTHYCCRSSSSGSGTSATSPPTNTPTSSPTYHTATQPDTLAAEYIKKTAKISPEAPPITLIPLSQEVPWLPPPVFATPSDSPTNTQVTTLSSGIRVASEPKFGGYCTVGVVLDSGSRYEVAHPSGISHFLEKLAFGATVNMSRQNIMDTFQTLGGICDCQTLRDAVIYAASVEVRGLERVVEVLAETVWRPLITPAELEAAQMTVSFDLENLSMRPEKDALLMEMIHKAAYRDNTVGLPKICPPENVALIGEAELLQYLRAHHTASRMVVAGVGVDHDALVEYVDKYFKAGSAVWDGGAMAGSALKVDESVAQYTGGSCLEEADLSHVSLGPQPLPELCHLVLGLQSVGHQHDDFVACCVLNVLMGGGGSFSAGGPGKGMYTRLYTNVLNKHHWMHNAVAFNHAYADSGLFCVLASAHPSNLHDLTQVLTSEMVAMASTITLSELERAKTQLQSMLLMNLESRPVVFEDMARQVLSTGHRKQPEYFREQIRAITLDDVHRVAGNMLRSKLSVAAYGSLSNLPPRPTIEAALMDSHGRLRPNNSAPPSSFFH